MLAWTKQNTMQRAMRTVLEWPQSHATRKTINMITNKYEPQQKCRLGTVSKKLLGGLNCSFLAVSYYSLTMLYSKGKKYLDCNILQKSDFVFSLFHLRLTAQSTSWSCRAWSVNLLTLFPGRFSASNQLNSSKCTNFCQ